MKNVFCIILTLFSVSAFSQEIRDLHPNLGRELDFGPGVQQEWAVRDRLLLALSKGEKEWDALTSSEHALLEKYSEVYESMWDVEGAGCSWYCGGGPQKVLASSSLSSQGDNNYQGSNAHDFSYKTAWVEGVQGYGIGEYLEYDFAPESPRINTVIVANGYVKSNVAWRNNSRVKRLKMYVDGRPYAVLNLEDVAKEQIFDVGIVGHNDRQDYDELKKKSPWKVRFEILDVYKGEKYDDVAITEIYFDGLDVHCLGRGTKITMADGSLKNIESLKPGDQVLSYNERADTYEGATIIELANPVHSNLIEIKFDNGKKLVATQDHPVFNGSGWFSFDPDKTRRDYRYDEVFRLEPGLELGNTRVTSIKALTGSQETFTIVKLSRNNIFIANEILVGTEELRTSEMQVTTASEPSPHGGE